MNQRTHSWIAIRAIALLEDENSEPNLVKLLKPFVREASVGAWIPDQVDAKRGGAGASTENHVLKMEPYDGYQTKRFTTSKEDLVKHCGDYRKVIQYLQQDNYLDNDWWSAPYKGDVNKPGKHLPNRISALCTMLKDLLLLGSKRVDSLIPGNIYFAQYLTDDVRTKEDAAAMYFFMLSHFIADISMPCHSDARKLSSYSNGLHKELEGHWSKKVGTYFEKKKLWKDNSNLSTREVTSDSNKVIKKAKEVGDKFNLKFSDNLIPDLIKGHDIWLEGIFLCRASFALSSIIAPYKQYPYDDSIKKAPFKTLFINDSDLLEKIDEIVMHDAVLNTAIFWKHLWNKVSKE